MKNQCTFEMVEVINKQCNTSEDEQVRNANIEGAKNWHNVMTSSKNLENSVRTALNNKSFPIVVGGDHT